MVIKQVHCKYLNIASKSRKWYICTVYSIYGGDDNINVITLHTTHDHLNKCINLWVYIPLNKFSCWNNFLTKLWTEMKRVNNIISCIPFPDKLLKNTTFPSSIWPIIAIVNSRNIKSHHIASPFRSTPHVYLKICKHF